MGSEYRLARHRGKFAVVWYEEGRRQRRSLGTMDIAEANVRIIEFKRSHLAATRSGPLTVGEIYERYASNAERLGRSASVRIRFAWRSLRGCFENLPPSRAITERAEDYFQSRSSNVSSGTIHLELGYLRAALRNAEKEGWITKTPYIPLPKKPEPKDHRLTREEARRLIDACSPGHIRLFIVLALTTAGRAGAILDLSWDRVDFERRRINLRNPHRSETSKGRALVPMNDTAYRELQQAKQIALTEYVIEYGGKAVKSIKKGFASAVRRAGISKCSPHDCRKLAARMMIQGGASIEEVAQYLGHSNIMTTRRIYARFSADYLKKAAGALEL